MRDPAPLVGKRGLGVHRVVVGPARQLERRMMVSNVVGLVKRLAVVFSIVILIALAHVFRIGSYLEGRWYDLYYSFFSDLVLPFACYFLLSADEIWIPILRRWEVKAAIAFLLPSIAETCQYFGIPVLGSTFDPLDYLMYGVGAMAAVVVDTQVFPRVFGFWTMEKAEDGVTSQDSSGARGGA
jgi:hypothetical protein